MGALGLSIPTEGLEDLDEKTQLLLDTTMEIAAEALEDDDIQSSLGGAELLAQKVEGAVEGQLRAQIEAIDPSAAYDAVLEHEPRGGCDTCDTACGDGACGTAPPPPPWTVCRRPGPR